MNALIFRHLYKVSQTFEMSGLKISGTNLQEKNLGKKLFSVLKAASYGHFSGIGK